MRNCGLSRRCTGISAGERYHHITPKIANTVTKNIGINKHKLTLLVIDDTTECCVSQEK